jgi:hypothetical protein
MSVSNDRAMSRTNGSGDRLADRIDIEGLLRTYAVGLDERRFDLWDNVFTDDAVIDFSPMNGRVETPAQMSARLGAADPAWLFAQHPVFNCLITFHDDRATATSDYLVETGRRTSALGGNEIVRMSGGGSYVDRMRHTADGWRIEHRSVSMKWKRTETVVDEIDRATR